MRLLLDQNISYRVVKQLKSLLSETIGVREAGLYNADDYQIRDYGLRNEYTVVTFDKDIPAIESVRGFPPKITWLRTGNLTNSAVTALFMNRLDEFANFIANNHKGCLMVYLGRTPDN